MRAPLSEIEPDSRGVSIWTRGDWARICSRLRVGTAPGWPGSGTPAGVWAGPVGAVEPGGAVVPGGDCGVPWPGVCCCCWVCCCWACFCLSICGMPTKICQTIKTTADSTMARSVFFWSFI